MYISTLDKSTWFTPWKLHDTTLLLPDDTALVAPTPQFVCPQHIFGRPGNKLTKLDKFWEIGEINFPWICQGFVACFFVWSKTLYNIYQKRPIFWDLELNIL